jgi:signal transduction histidine kinase
VRLSISAKIFVGFVVVLATFGGVATFGAVQMRRLGDELRLVSRGYVDLQQQVSELQNGQSNLLRVLFELNEKSDTPRVPKLLKWAVDEARVTRLKRQTPAVLQAIAQLEALRSTPEEHGLLARLKRKLQQIDQSMKDDELLLDEVFGPIGGDAPMIDTKVKEAAEQLLRREQSIKLNLANLSAELRLRSHETAVRLEQEENRAVWATLILSVVVVVVGVAVMLLATRAVRPLRRLAERAKEIARGDYKQRVDVSSADEIGALGREFNAMAAALEQREAELIRSERLATVGKVAAQITHEVRNPLSSIGLNAEMLEEELAALEGSPAMIEELKGLARAIVKEVDRLTEITEEYLRFARLPRPKLEREDLGEIVSSLLAFMKQELDGRNIAVDAQLQPLPPVAADEQQMRQALLNLLRNAAEAMRDGGRLEIAAAPDGAHVRLTIRDSGQGIAPEHLPKIFDPFFSTKEHGTGLGLALTRQIIVEHGGAIEVQSELQRGTTFVVRLPALQRSDGAQDSLAPQRAQG